MQAEPERESAAFAPAPGAEAPAIRSIALALRAPLSAAQILALQRSAGNAVVTRWLQRTPRMLARDVRSELAARPTVPALPGVTRPGTIRVDGYGGPPVLAPYGIYSLDQVEAALDHLELDSAVAFRLNHPEMNEGQIRQALSELIGRGEAPSRSVSIRALRAYQSRFPGKSIRVMIARYGNRPALVGLDMYEAERNDAGMATRGWVEAAEGTRGVGRQLIADRVRRVFGSGMDRMHVEVFSEGDTSAFHTRLRAVAGIEGPAVEGEEYTLNTRQMLRVLAEWDDRLTPEQRRALVNLANGLDEPAPAAASRVLRDGGGRGGSSGGGGAGGGGATSQGGEPAGGRSSSTLGAEPVAGSAEVSPQIRAQLQREQALAALTALETEARAFALRMRIYGGVVGAMLQALEAAGTYEQIQSMRARGTVFEAEQARADHVASQGQEAVDWATEVTSRISLIGAVLDTAEAEQSAGSGAPHAAAAGLVEPGRLLSIAAGDAQRLHDRLSRQAGGLQRLRDVYAHMTTTPVPGQFGSAGQAGALAMEESIQQILGRVETAAARYESAAGVLRLYGDFLTGLAMRNERTATSRRLDEIQREQDALRARLQLQP